MFALLLYLAWVFVFLMTENKGCSTWFHLRLPAVLKHQPMLCGPPVSGELKFSIVGFTQHHWSEKAKFNTKLQAIFQA